MRLLLLSLILTALTCSACSRGGVRGGAHTETPQAQAVVPVHPAGVVWVKDFALDLSNFKSEQGIINSIAITSRLQDIRRGDAQERARGLVDQMSESLVSDLRKAGFTAQRLPANTPPPASGWLIAGEFSLVDEGNRTQRAVIGMGQGSSLVDVDVAASDLQKPDAPFAVFTTVSDPAHKPPTPNPYAMAARFILEKNSTGHDVEHVSEQIVNELAAIQKKALTSPHCGLCPQ
ncbi:DUF4410 domain-containing protein [Candidatus Methylospira mobilis]|uniref:DUF4410 domain-containing protein n=1 Tax=Candidatus Methylospira mobilis TaxID=1808979 RepID=A0A5Q0BNU8_9GAMM|nr:DUF4410 domain-containing protein [Candidatus Methylospira mobilis]QFY43874.1 DUF4410 domain-containing protein [Candidatus Methylospira mobilis]WNV04875.1 DUF4410 domain-containing protein [Candidatus Methylospira mobilis]